jgi:hypothetical protein
MLTLDGTATARAAAGVAGTAWLVTLSFTTGTVRYTTAPVDITSGGNTYTGLGNLTEVSLLGESENSSAERLTLSLSIVNSSMLASVMGDPTTYKGKAAALSLQLIDDTYQIAGAAVARWQGYMDKVLITRTASPSEGGGSSGKIELQCTRAGMARARLATGLRLTAAQLQARYSGDLGLDYVQTLVEQPSLWLSKRFQEQP